MSNLMQRKSMGGTWDLKLDDGFCIANCGIGKDWCTIYLIETHPEHRNCGEAERLIKYLQKQCKDTNKKLRLWCPMNETIEHICKKLNLETI